MSDANSSSAKDSWARWLKKDEELLWVGEPNADLLFNLRFFKRFGAWGLLGFGFGSALIAMLTNADFQHDSITRFFDGQGAAILMVFGGLFGALGLTLGAFYDRKRRRATFYSLTNKRAVVAHRWPWRTMQSFPLHATRQRILGYSLLFQRTYPSPTITFTSFGAQPFSPKIPTSSGFTGFELCGDSLVVLETLGNLGFDTDYWCAQLKSETRRIEESTT